MSQKSAEAGLGFVHLHVHSSFSLREGAMGIGKLAKLAAADHMPALAITDGNNLFGALEFSEKLAKEGVQPIIGAELTLDFRDGAAISARGEELGAGRASIVLIAKDEAGYLNLMHLVSRAWLDPEPGDPPHVPIERLRGRTGGMIALSGGPAGPLDRAFAARRSEQAFARAAQLAELFPDRLYIELQRHNLAAEREAEPRLLDLAYRKSLPLVAANEPYFGTSSDYEAHDALICIAEGTVIGDGARRQLSPEHRFKTRAEMVALFADLPEASRNTVEIARRCAFRPLTRKPLLPRFSATGELEAEADALRSEAEAGLEARIEAHGLAKGFTAEDYRKRLAFELDVIVKMKFPGYFLIVSDFIKYAKSQGIPVGPGRGSGAGSLVAYALTITDLDPIRFGLLFERFLNPERVSMPDFDIDFCQDRRDEVIAYVRRRYGADKVAQIITFGSFLARGVLRNVGRVLEMPLGQVDRLAKLVPQNPAAPVSLKQAIDSEPRLKEAAEAEPRVAKMLQIAQTLEGLYSNASTHAAGIVIGDRPLEQLVPLYRDPKSDMPATQFNMKWVEPAGLVKFDFLGLKTLTTLSTCVKLLRRRGIEIEIDKIPLDDSKTYAMLGRGETIGVFQLESAGMRRALVDMHADRFEDIIALVALYRPGPMANIPRYCAVKAGEEEADYIHPKIEGVLKETFGVIIYQEQVMQIAQILSGYSLGEADLLRRAMGKKIKAEMDAQRDRFLRGAIDNGLAKAKANEIFDLLAKFADYGFNKSHAAAYALIAYQTAWFKANYPLEFLAASMTLDKANTDKLAEFSNEARRLNGAVEPPSIQRSGADFEVCANDAGELQIRYALGAIKGVGQGHAEALVAARNSKPFRDFADFSARIDPRAINKRMLESLVAAGAFDEMEPDRARVFAAIETILASAHRRDEERRAGQSALFGAGAEDRMPLPKVAPWTLAERLRREFDSVGFFLSGHPLDAYATIMSRLRVQRWTEFSRAVKLGATGGRLAATVLDRQERRTKSGSKMGIVQLSDPSGQYEAILFQEGLNQYRDLLEKGASLLLVLQAAVEGDEVRARIVSAEPLDHAASRVQKGLRIFVADDKPLDQIKQSLRPQGDGEVALILQTPECEIELKLPGKYGVSAQSAGALKAIPGILAVEHV
ncbi:DNA polymerase III, alpha subunit [Methylocella silvestris BL2]|uniref:DNA polymerase III subunit alpha n=1 Tax=Methylocella silvestris (strain DSM 15510 / CIP 108128 / LMG 27833 / NCIMB 13906 / BL2) TaxID=395965 RepID=B8EKA5_METSB|nr:DNA polymerase III subunit alpha [Methylocella silvestris]ACK50645.1 DNA polymerase III, alpha subunit [Methylocella silvestris BL2]